MLEQAPMLLGLLVVGGVAGAVNTVAGGGSMFVLPALIAMGLEPQLANGTNRVGVVAQATAAVRSFGARGVPWAPTATELVLVCAGSAAGAATAATIDPRGFARAAAVLLLGVGASAWVGAEGWRPPSRPLPRPVGWALLLVAGFHGGFLQAGVGFLLLGAMVFGSGRTVASANPVKSTLTLALTVPALLLFWTRGQVALLPGVALGVGGALGGHYGAGVAASLSPRALRGALTVMVALVALNLLGR